LHHFWRSAERGRAFRGVENGKPSAGSRANVKKSASIAKAFHDGIHGARNFCQFAAYSESHASVFSIEDAQNFERGLAVESASPRISLLGF
jgi:hypothetical protein